MPKLFSLHIITKVNDKNEILFLDKWNNFVTKKFIGDTQIFIDYSDAEVHLKFLRAMNIEGALMLSIDRLIEYIDTEFQ